jgi:hypothetical protein
MNLFGEKPKQKRNIPKVPENSKPYFPSNGSEGLYFEDINCLKCSKYSKCSILRRTYEGKKVKQWIKEEGKEPRCISLRRK